MRHVTHMNESCHTHEWVTSHMWMRHVTLMNEARHTHEWGMSHTWMRHVTHMNEACHTHMNKEIGVLHICFCPVIHTFNMTCQNNLCDTPTFNTHIHYTFNIIHVEHEIHLTWQHIRIAHIHDMATHSHCTHSVHIQYSIQCVAMSSELSRHAYEWGIPHTNMDEACHSMWCPSVICVTWLIHMRDIIHSYVWHDSFVYGTWLIHMCDMTQ